MRVKVNRGLALPTSEYFAEPQVKSGIALHHTARGGEHRRLGRSIGLIATIGAGFVLGAVVHD